MYGQMSKTIVAHLVQTMVVNGISWYHGHLVVGHSPNLPPTYGHLKSFFRFTAGQPNSSQTQIGCPSKGNMDEFNQNEHNELIPFIPLFCFIYFCFTLWWLTHNIYNILHLTFWELYSTFLKPKLTFGNYCLNNLFENVGNKLRF